MWVLNDQVELDFINEITTYPDRVVGVVLGTIVDDRLTAAIKAKLRKEPGTDDIFRDGAALGNFGTRVRLGFMIGLYGVETRRDLLTIKDIRNAFAHRVEAKDFDFQQIRQWAFNLELPSREIILIEPGGGVEWRLNSPEHIGKPTTARDRFVRTIQMLAQMLRLEATAYAGDPQKEPRF